MATAFYAVADVAVGELRFANAGHPSPFLIRRNASIAQPLKFFDPQHGPALGLFDKSNYPNCRVALELNDLILLFTDGLYEVDNQESKEYGQERLLEAVRQRCRLPAAQLFDELLKDVQNFSSGQEFDDDVCVVGLEVARLGNS